MAEVRGLRKDLAGAFSHVWRWPDQGTCHWQRTRAGDWMVRRNRVIYQVVPDGNEKGSSESLSEPRDARSGSRSLSRHFSQLPGSIASP